MCANRRSRPRGRAFRSKNIDRAVAEASSKTRDDCLHHHQQHMPVLGSPSSPTKCGIRLIGKMVSCFNFHFFNYEDILSFYLLINQLFLFLLPLPLLSFTYFSSSAIDSKEHFKPEIEHFNKIKNMHVFFDAGIILL